ncbi:uncharacterized protein LOC116393700 [Anarrhichthys ocellatus]|uniref:uncharacterized protein LOC116393700 n=1 Tax=Anarrhichthys ocellatus TaxID=433405 RepID=UPI0012EDC593|nr:uncharacterized protein LOC116393700 [Anarrhichthys ocellatus]
MGLLRIRLFSAIVRDGDEVTLPCNSVIDDHKNCNSTEWLFTDSAESTGAKLVINGTIVEEANAKSDRLSVSENCSLVIKNVTEEDGGVYIFSSGQQHALVHLAVFTLTEHEDNDEVTLNCSHTTYDQCVRTVKWLLHGQDVDEDNKDIKTSQSHCTVSLTFLTSYSSYTSRFNSFKCGVTEGDKVHQFSFRNLPSGEDAITATTESTPTEDGREAANTTTPSAISDASPKLQSWWRFIFVSVGLAALIIIAVAVNMWARIIEKKTQMDQIAVRYDGEDDSVTYENIRHQKTSSSIRLH